MPEETLDPEAGDIGALLLEVIARVKEGDFSARMPLDWTGVPGKIADGLNEASSTGSRRTPRIAH